MFRKIVPTLLGITLTAFFIFGCARATPTPVPTPTAPPATATRSPTVTITPSPTASPTATPTFTPTPIPVSLSVWVQDDSSTQNRVAYMRVLADLYAQTYRRVELEVTSKTRAELRQLIAAETASFPDLLWAEHEFVLVGAQTNRAAALDGLFDPNAYLAAAVAAAENGEHVWGIPVAGDNFLLLYYNQQFVPHAPTDTRELEAAARAAPFIFPERLASEVLVPLTESAAAESAPQIGAVITNGVAGLVFPQYEPLWLVPWLHGFGSELFETAAFSATITALPPLSDRVAARFPYQQTVVEPTLNTPEMLKTLRLLHSWKFEQRIIPDEADYAAVDRMFREGRAALIINSDRAMEDYLAALGENLGVAPPLRVADGGLLRPYVTFTYLMISAALPPEDAELARDFIEFVTSRENQLALLEETGMTPLNITALDDPAVTTEPRRRAQVEQFRAGIPFPASAELRCFWDAMRPELNAVFENRTNLPQAALDMQRATEACLEFMR